MKAVVWVRTLHSGHGALVTKQPARPRTLYFRTLGLAISASLISVAIPAFAEKSDIRFYHLHKQDGQVRIRNKNTDETGCHNFGWRKKGLHRVALTGYSACYVYSEKNCPQDKLLSAMWDGKQYRQADIDITQPQSKLLRGSRWMFAKKNIKAQSWSCEN